ncbi:ATP-dependent DNA helicase RecG [Thioflexithrix psekupsensis]|uniref:ATP-dependent DNA helicase RecG n=1 Tax=Thioflexithrix psekupsensis TaxID=1570016 RepID=A0A251XAS8_9GAMM|nr:ATP-dependent DNA helicase RecG [Thioflexithrix psekupsensis]OUD15047.1 ATP-dependent DNA helicase RecG [Thioflexithrix psekupsensis]
MKTSSFPSDFQDLRGLGAASLARLARLGIHNVEDLLFHLPLRYQDRTRIKPIGTLKAGETAVISGTITASEIRPGQRKRSLWCTVTDGTGFIALRFFHFNSAQQQQLQVGIRVRCFGDIRAAYHQQLEMVHPEYKTAHPDQELSADSETLTAVYPSCEGLAQHQLRRLMAQALDYTLTDYLPPHLLQQYQWPSLNEALRMIHCPPPDSPFLDLQNGTHPACRRLAFEELLAHHLSLRLLREQRLHAPRLHSAGAWELQLPFALTQAQQRVYSEILSDLQQDRPMLRLVQGDVGSGKTVVAALAALRAIEAGYQVAMMAPTELLAEQHHRVFSHWSQSLNLITRLLTGQLTKKQRQKIQQQIANGEAHFIVGTQALFQEPIQFARLGLIIIDEQHRFGVDQRLALRDKGQHAGLIPHQLIMTATPIPRTLAMTAYADLDSSIIDELPPGRTPIHTAIISNLRRDDIIERIRVSCLVEKRQVYWVCTLIEESEHLQCQAAEDTEQQLKSLLPMLKIALIHGRMKPKEKEAVMQLFKSGELDLLVATTVIEVGVDVPNATLMVIENAERLGLAQLHQLRGRVGRGAQQSYCVLLYQAPLSELARERLAIMRETNDGFLIAQRDLELRGPGELLGTKQTGQFNWRIARLPRDEDLLNLIPHAAQILLENPAHCHALTQRWLKQDGQYATV